MAWGGFCINGKTNLFCFRQIMDARFYVEILQQHSQKLTKCSGWVNGGFSKIMTPSIVVVLLKPFLMRILQKSWTGPSNSPDLNPIENLCAIVKGNVEKRMPQNISKLEQFMVGIILDTVVIT